jgi:hypothetical protein
MATAIYRLVRTIDLSPSLQGTNFSNQGDYAFFKITCVVDSDLSIRIMQDSVGWIFVKNPLYEQTISGKLENMRIKRCPSQMSGFNFNRDN